MVLFCVALHFVIAVVNLVDTLVFLTIMHDHPWVIRSAHSQTGQVFDWMRLRVQLRMIDEHGLCKWLRCFLQSREVILHNIHALVAHREQLVPATDHLFVKIGLSALAYGVNELIATIGSMMCVVLSQVSLRCLQHSKRIGGVCLTSAMHCEHQWRYNPIAIQDIMSFP